MKKIKKPASTEDYSVDEKNPFLNTLHLDCELFKDEDDILSPTIRVKRFKTKAAEEWRIYNDKEVVLILKGTRFTNNEKTFLRTLDGFQFIINGYKQGWKSVSKFKQGLENDHL
jgi:hypothetical protein